LIVDGEVLVMLHKGTTKNESGFAVEFIDPDRLDWTLNETRNGSKNKIKMGVEMDEQGEPLAYWILDEHPNEMLVAHSQRLRRRIPAEFIKHSFLEEQTGQTRGVSLLASAALRAHLLDQFERATVIGGIVAARKVGFYKINQEKAEEYGVLGNDLDDDGLACEDVNDDATMIHNVEDGQFEQLPSYVDGIESFSSEYPPANFEEFEKRMIRGMASGFGGQYHVIANDLEGVNFSSARAGELEQRKVWKEIQQLMIEEFLEDQFEEWGAMSLLRKDFDFDRGKLQKVISMELYEFVPQGWPWVDPVKEMEANKLALDLRLTTRQAIISESSGGDFTDIVDQLGEEKKYMESKGVAPLDEVEVEQQANSQPAE
jgi:lambda family phage portal protein